jgi:hypothetical protein
LQAIAALTLAIALLEDITQILTMKHSDWLRLQSEGESICATLRQQGYQCRKQTRRLSWKVCSLGQDDYVLTWLPAPISDWTLMPNDTSPQRQQLWQLIEHTLTSIRGEVMKTLPKRTLQAEDYSRPWAIIRLLPDARRYTVARFFNRQDAEDHRRFLNRFMPAAEFEVFFDVPDEQLQHTTDQKAPDVFNPHLPPQPPLLRGELKEKLLFLGEWKENFYS